MLAGWEMRIKREFSAAGIFAVSRLKARERFGLEAGIMRGSHSPLQQISNSAY